MNQLVQDLDWTYMAIIYENDTYGNNGVKDLLSSITSRDVCFPYKISVNPLDAQESLVQTLDADLRRIVFDANITGLLVFGSTKLATAVMKATEIIKNNTSEFTIPVFLFSEASSYLEGTFRGVSKGAFAVSPPRKSVQEFDKHWIDIFTDLDILYNTIPSNVYIKQLYETTFECSLADSKENHNCSTLSREEVGKMLRPSLYNQYAIQAAMTVSKVAKEIYEAECPSAPNCDELYIVPRKRFIDVLNTLTIKFDDDFSLRLDAFKDPVDLEISFNGKSDATLPSGYPVYAVYNHQKCNADPSVFCFEEVRNKLLFY